MNLGIENIHLNREDWPEVLSPDLRRQLLLSKLARAQQTVEQRKKCANRQLLGELEGTTIHELFNQQ